MVKLLFQVWSTISNIREQSPFDAGRNLALRKPANASSSLTDSFQLYASNVVDGSPSGDFNNLTCHSVEFGDLNPWWQVDLQAVYRISRVKIVGRSDCCVERLHDFSIEMYMDDPAVSVNIQSWLCYRYKGVFRPTTQDIKCDSVVSGRFVKLSRKMTENPEEPVSLCEISVYGPGTLDVDFRLTNLSLTDVIVMKLPVGIIHCCVICATNPLCMAVKMVRERSPTCQLVYRRVHRAKETTLTLSSVLVLTRRYK